MAGDGLRSLLRSKFGCRDHSMEVYCCCRDCNIWNEIALGKLCCLGCWLVVACIRHIGHFFSHEYQIKMMKAIVFNISNSFLSPTDVRGSIPKNTSTKGLATSFDVSSDWSCVDTTRIKLTRSGRRQSAVEPLGMHGPREPENIT